MATSLNFVEGEVPAEGHQLLAGTLDTTVEEIKQIRDEARTNGFTQRPQWPMIILRTPKGWTGPEEVGGLPVEGMYRTAWGRPARNS